MTTTTTWEPAREGVEQVGQLLREYIQPNADQKVMYERLQECSEILGFQLVLGADFV